MVFPAGGREPFLCVRVVGCSSLARPPDSFYRSLERGVRNGTLFPFVMDVLSVSDAVRRSSPFVGGRAEAFFLTGKKLQSVYSILRCAGYLFPVVFQGVSIGPVPACEAGLGPLQKSWEGAGGGTGGGRFWEKRPPSILLKVAAGRERSRAGRRRLRRPCCPPWFRRVRWPVRCCRW